MHDNDLRAGSGTDPDTTGRGAGLPIRPLIIGVAGYKNSGKDTFATLAMDILTNEGKYSCRRVAFADPLREEVAVALNVMDNTYSIRSYIEMMNDRATKEKFRLIMQWWGTEFRRQLCPGAQDEDYWVHKVKTAISKHLDDVFLIPDVRLPHEIAFIRSCGGKTVWVSRKGTSVGNHVTESSIGPEDCDIVTGNTDEMSSFKTSVRDLLFRYVLST